jgi:hypothetical protein
LIQTTVVLFGFNLHRLGGIGGAIPRPPTSSCQAAPRDQVEHRDTLFTIAEIAVALAGFASLVSVIGGRQNDTSRVIASLRLRTMLEVAFRNTFFALLPLPFLQLAPSDPIVWRISSGLYISPSPLGTSLSDCVRTSPLARVGSVSPRSFFFRSPFSRAGRTCSDWVVPTRSRSTSRIFCLGFASLASTSCRYPLLSSASSKIELLPNTGFQLTTHSWAFPNSVAFRRRVSSTSR